MDCDPPHGLPIDLRPGAVTLLAARPCAGKSTLALLLGSQVIYDTCRAVVVMALADSEDQARQRAVEAIADFVGPMARLPSDYERAALARARAWLMRAPFVIDDLAGATVEDVAAAIRRARATFGRVGLVIVDYVQLLAEMSKVASTDRAEVFRSVLERLKLIARVEDTAILVLSQLPRTVDTHPDRRPRLEDLDPALALSAVVDGVVFLYREHNYAPDAPPTHVEMIQALPGAGGPSVATVYLPLGPR